MKKLDSLQALVADLAKLPKWGGFEGEQLDPLTSRARSLVKSAKSKKLFTHFKIQLLPPDKGEKPFRFERGLQPRMLQRELAPGIWAIHLDLGTRCCLVGTGGGDRSRGFKIESLCLVNNCEQLKALYEFQMFHKCKQRVSLLGEIHKDYYEGIAIVGEWDTEDFPYLNVSRRGK